MPLPLSGPDLNARAAAAGARLVGIVEDEAGRQLIALEVHLDAEQKQDRRRL